MLALRSASGSPSATACSAAASMLAPLVVFPSNNHILQADEPAFATFVDEVERFVAI